jgi:heat shock protein HtpX
VTLQQQIRQNRLRSSIVVLGFVVLLVLLAGLVGLALDVSLGVVALVVALLYAIVAIVRSRSMIAGITHAQQVEANELRPLRRLVENVSIGAGLPVTPEVRIVDDAAPNAFAAGLRPTASYVGVTTGLLRTMPKRELEAVLAHELSHIRNRDTYLMTMATIFAGVIALIADLGFRSMAYGGRSRKGGALVAILALVGFVLAPYAALLLRMSLSRRREYLADAGAAEILNDPEAMALALRRLALDSTTIRYADASPAHLWVESPTDRVESERRGVLAMSGLFNTHPAIGDRIAALEEAGGFRLPDRLAPDAPFAEELGLA